MSTNSSADIGLNARLIITGPSTGAPEGIAAGSPACLHTDSRSSVLSGDGSNMDAKEKNAFQQRCGSMTAEDLLPATRVHRMDHQDESSHRMDRQLSSLKEKIIKREQAEKQQYRGIRGWLIVFILMVAGGSLISLLSGIVELREVKGFLGILLFIPQALIAIYGFDVFVLLLCEKPSAPTHAARWMIANAAYNLIMAILVYALTRSTAGFIVFPSALGLTLWLMYLAKSKRVAATYKWKTAKYAVSRRSFLIRDAQSRRLHS
jgi:hypothetical protein